MTSSNIGFPILSFGHMGSCAGGGTPCNYTVTTGALPSDPGIQNGDAVWIEPTPADGAESARGYWLVSNVLQSGVPSSSCSGTCTFTLTNSVASGTNSTTAILETGKIRTIAKNGVPATEITEIAANDANLKFIQIGQTVSDKTDSACFPGPTTVTGVWPAIGVVYVSAPSQCDSGMTPHQFAFQDNPYSGTASDCPQFTPGASPPENVPGCIIFDADFRWGDGFHLEKSGGTGMVNCHVFEHMVSFHLSTGARSTFATNCATGNELSLPDRNLGALTDSSSPNGNIISLLIDGDHQTHSDGETDACEADWTNSVLGQHRSAVVVVQSDCISPTRIANAGMGAAADNNSGVTLEVDAGGISLVNGHATGASSVNIAEKATLYYPGGSTDPQGAELRIGNNAMHQVTLNVQNNNAASVIEGCGNVFAAPTPYLCAPSSFTQLPGGRLTLAQNQPVMHTDVTNATTIYYAPYVSQQVPIYSASAGNFGLQDSTASGLTLILDSQVAGSVYDIFAGFDSGGTLELCSGPAWSASNAFRSASGQIAQTSGVWTNTGTMSCHYNATGPGGGADLTCAAMQCTYLGSAYMTATGQTAQQFGPVSGSGGGAPCLCLYNTYNHVTLTSASADSGATYGYALPAWRYMNNSAGNSITVLDGLQQMQISAQLNDAMSNAAGTGSPRTAAMGIDFLPPGGVLSAPAPIVQASSTTKGSYAATVTSPPLFGPWAAHAVESANTGTAGTPNFGGSGYQQLSVQVAD